MNWNHPFFISISLYKNLVMVHSLIFFLIKLQKNGTVRKKIYQIWVEHLKKQPLRKRLFIYKYIYLLSSTKDRSCQGGFQPLATTSASPKATSPHSPEYAYYK